MDLALSLIAVLLSLSVVFIGVFLALRASRGSGARPKARQQEGSFVVIAGSDTGGSRKGSNDGDGRDSGGHDGGGGDGGGGGGD
jgi:uncharacterized membrane protein YgcG